MDNQNPERILLIIPEMIVGGAQRSLSKLSIELARYFQVWVVIFNRDLPVAYPCGGELISLDIRVGGGITSKISSLRARVRKLRALKSELYITTSISFLEGADYINILSRINEKVILSIRGSKLHDETMKRKFSWIRRSVLIPWLYPKADHIVAVNKGIASELKDNFKINVPITVISNFYDPEEVRALTEETLDPKLLDVFSSPVLITTGRLAVEKGLDFLIRVFARVKISHPAAHLMIVGDGPSYGQLVAIARDLKLKVVEKDFYTADGDVHFMGNQQNVYKFLRHASLYLMASSSEGFPNGLVEAMACGVPVMSADCPYGPREILAPGTDITSLSDYEFAPFGILMPLAPVDHLADDRWVRAIEKLLDDEEMLFEYRQQGRTRSLDFSVEAAIRKWMNIMGQSHRLNSQSN